MAWNPAPDIAALRDFGNKFNRPVVVTFSIDANGEGFHITTYGKTKALCKLAASFGEQIAEAVKDGRIEPPDVEPFDVPPASVVWTRDDPAQLRRERDALREAMETLATLDDWDKWPEPEEACNQAAEIAREALSPTPTTEVEGDE